MSDSVLPHGTVAYQPPPSPSSTVSLSLLKFMSIESVMLSNHLFLCRPLLLLPSIFPGIRVFSSESLFASGDQSIGASASASVLPMNIQGWFPLGLTCLISLQSQRLSRVFSSTIVQRHQFFGTQPSLTHILGWKSRAPSHFPLPPSLSKEFNKSLLIQSLNHH